MCDVDIFVSESKTKTKTKTEEREREREGESAHVSFEEFPREVLLRILRALSRQLLLTQLSPVAAVRFEDICLESFALFCGNLCVVVWPWE